jgi:hypothetical protein
LRLCCAVLPAQMIWMISASLYTMLKDSPPDARACVHLYCMRTYKIPRAILEKVRCICEPAFIASCFPLPDPIRQVVEVNDMYLDKVMAPLWTRDAI